MKLKNYQSLIQHLPVRDQGFTTKKSTWDKFGANNASLHSFNEILFCGNAKEVFISRRDIFETAYTTEIILKVIYWGYPRGMRGNNFQNILSNWEEPNGLISILENINTSGNVEMELITELYKSRRGIKGIGMPTLTKLLYFMNGKIGDIPCIILDSRIVEILSSSIFEELNEFPTITYENAHLHYYGYIKTMDKLAKEMGTNAENIELFLFTFGKNLKSGVL